MAKNNEYKVLVGIDYPPNKRAEAGDVVSDLPKESISWLLAQEIISANTPAASSDAPEIVSDEEVLDEEVGE